MHQGISISTHDKRELIDISDKVQNFLDGTQLKNGLINVFARHTTCAVIVAEINESLDTDLFNLLEKITPPGPYNHQHGDAKHAPAHLLSSIVGQSITIPFSEGEIQLGTWQRVCLLELDGPRRREITITAI